MTLLKGGKAASPLRWAILLLASAMMIANYYCYDIPAALQSQMSTYISTPNFTVYFNLLYSLYSLPNIVLPFFGGYFVDKLGVRFCLFVFATLITSGAIVFSFGLSIKSWPVMFIGRVLYGFGGESLGVANSALLSQWFRGKELAFAFGFNLSVARLGSVMNNNVSPLLAKASGLPFACWFGSILCAGSVFSVILMGAVDKRFDELEAKGGMMTSLLDSSLQEEGEDVEEEVRFQPGSSSSSSSSSSSAAPAAATAAERAISVEGRPIALSSDLDADRPPEIREALRFPQPFWVLALSCVVVYGCVLPFNNIASSLLLERNYFMKQPNSACALLVPTACQNSTNVPNPATCDTAQYFAPPLPSTVSSSSVDCTASDACTTDYCDALNSGVAKANQVMSIPYIISACLSPFLGGFVDRFGLRAIIAAAAPAALVVVHSILGYDLAVDPIGPLVGQGLSYAGFAAVLWPAVPLVVEQRLIGLAYGVVTSIQNGGLAAFPLIVSGIYTSKGAYIPYCENFFISLACLGFCIGLYLNLWDARNGGIFNKPHASSAPSSSSPESGEKRDLTSASGSIGDAKEKEFARAREHSTDVGRGGGSRRLLV